MAEYFMSYKELSELIDEFIDKSEDKEALVSHRSEIMSAITGEFYQQNVEIVQDTIALWNNQDLARDEAVWGTKYIRIHNIMISFLEAALCSGFVDAIIQYASTSNIAGFTVSAGASIALALWKIFTSVKSLDDWDFCVYMQAVTHFRKHKEFSIEELRDWLPSDKKPKCNMHSDNWKCDHRDKNDQCLLRNGKRLQYALDSLMDKGVLSRTTEHGVYHFRFVK